MRGGSCRLTQKERRQKGARFTAAKKKEKHHLETGEPLNAKDLYLRGKKKIGKEPLLNTAIRGRRQRGR